VLFARQASYFAPDSAYAPLLHTWTLSVEEQFYICWPLLLRFFTVPAVSKWKVPASISVLLGSLLLSAHWVNAKPNKAFFLLPSRAWELGLGALLCFPSVTRTLVRIPRAVASIASLAGIFMLGAAVFGYDRLTPFPGFAALLPCVGAALIIAAGEGGSSIGGRILSLRPLVWVGLISYSLYLWHWPILVFGRIIANRDLDTVERAGLIGLTFIVAWISWRFVERPFRNARVARSESRKWVIRGLATSAIFLSVGLILVKGDGLPARGPDAGNFDSQVVAQEKALQTSPCLVQRTSLPPVQGCLLGAPSPADQYEIVLWGDSHAAHLAPAFSDVGSRLGVTTREIAKSGCPPVPGVRFFPVYEMRVDCPAFNDAVVSAVLADKKVRVVVLAARWDAMIQGLVGSYAGDAALLTLDGKRPSVGDSRQLFVASLRKLLVTLVDSGHQVILVSEVPLPLAADCIARAEFNRKDPSVCEREEGTQLADTEATVNQALQEASADLEPPVQIVHPYDYLCGNQGCAVQANGQTLYMDDTHLSYNGVRLLESGLQNSIASALLATQRPSESTTK